MCVGDACVCVGGWGDVLCVCGGGGEDEREREESPQSPQARVYMRAMELK